VSRERSGVYFSETCQRFPPFLANKNREAGVKYPASSVRRLAVRKITQRDLASESVQFDRLECAEIAAWGES
jgi:hypothetical protein